MVTGKVKVYGHPRSGNHYLLNLLNKNFLTPENKICIEHRGIDDQGTHADIKYGVKMIFIHRDTENVLNSIYQMRYRYTFDEDNYDVFKTKRIGPMWDNVKARCQLRVDTYTGAGKIQDINDPYFGKFQNMTIREEINLYNNSWLPFATSNKIHIVKYENLLNDFQNVMEGIAKYLNVDKTEFEDIDNRVGFIALNKDGGEPNWIKGGEAK